MMARVSRTMKTAKAAFSKSVNWTSIGRNSTRQPMGEPGGGGLKRIVCQLVDQMFCRRQTSAGSLTHLEVIRRDAVVLVDRLGEDDERIPNEQMRDVIGQQVIDAAIDERLLDLGVDRHVVVVVLGPICRVVREVAVDAVISRLGDDARRRREWLRRQMRWRSVAAP